MKNHAHLGPILLLASTLLVSWAGTAADQTTPGTLSLMSTFECISVRTAFSGDDNANNSAAIQYRKAGSGTWLNAYPPAVDRRKSINGLDNTFNAFQARGSIVGLTPNTSYEVTLTWSDADGVGGANPIKGTISTLSYTPPTNGVTRWVDAAVGMEGSGTPSSPFKTISNAIQSSNPGDTIVVKSGTYAPFTIYKSGTSSAYFVLKPNTGAEVIIQGETDNLRIDANYWRIIGLRFLPGVESSIVVGSRRHHIYIEDTVSSDISTGNVWGSGGVATEANVNNVYILRNQINRTSIGEDNVDGVFIRRAGTHTLVIADNVITGPFWDGIGNGVNSYPNTMENSDICRNTLSGFQDDSIELDGGSPNLRVWSNRVVSKSASAISEGGTIVGPSYIFRNTLVNTNPRGTGIKQGHNADGACFVFHNVVETTGGGGNETVGQAAGTPFSENHVYRNNIFKATGNAYYHEGRSNSYDYDLLYAPGFPLVKLWNSAYDYPTLAAFQSGTGQELHGLSANPMLNSDKTLQIGSPAIDKGVVLPNFNDASSAWPFAGIAPDLGAFESGTPVIPVPPSAPGSIKFATTP